MLLRNLCIRFPWRTRIGILAQDNLQPFSTDSGQTSLWHSRADDIPFDDPFWAFYWPGGQALTRYILDNKSIFRHKTVLDVGSGCGALAIACALSGAAHVIANDICSVALTAVEMNCKLNNVSVCLNATNFLGQIQQHWDIVLLGDMFYDEDFARQIEKWVQQLYEHGKRIFIGDPGRVGFDKKLLNRVQNVLTVDLPTVSQWENNGLTQGFVWEYYISMT